MASTFTSFASQITFAANKAMSYIMNTNAVNVVKVRKIAVKNNQTSSVTGVICQLELRKYSTALTFTGNTSITPTSLDSANTALTGTITAGSATTIATGTLLGTLDRMFWSSDEPAISTATNDELQCLNGLTTLYEWIPHSDVQPITLRENQALVVFNTTGAAGLLDTIITFTVE
jgi:hypothetical protein